MRMNLNRAVRTMALALLVCCMIVPALAQEQPSDDLAVNGPATGRYAVLPLRLLPGYATAPPVAPLQTWNGTFTYHATPYPYVMVGQDPSGGLSTTVKTFIVPVKVVITTGSTHTTYSPAHVLSNGNSVTKNTKLSPIFDKTTTYTQGSINVGTTQYVDAYQRANFWGTVQSQAGLSRAAGRPHGAGHSDPDVRRPRRDITARRLANRRQRWTSTGSIPSCKASSPRSPRSRPTRMVIFLTYNVYLTQGGCCIGGYHTAIGVPSGIQTYMEFTYVDHTGIFSQDVSALSHEVGEWMDDPLTNGGNNSPCGIMENGDPLEGGQPGHPYGDWAYTLNGFTYHVQDLVTLPYFGAPTSTSVNGWLSFQNASLSVCSNGS